MRKRVGMKMSNWKELNVRDVNVLIIMFSIVVLILRCRNVSYMYSALWDYSLSFIFLFLRVICLSCNITKYIRHCLVIAKIKQKLSGIIILTHNSIWKHKIYIYIKLQWICCEISELLPPWDQYILFIRMAELLNRDCRVTGRSENKTYSNGYFGHLAVPMNVFASLASLPTKYKIITQFRNKEKKTILQHKSEISEPIRGGNTICQNLTNMTISEVEMKNEFSFKRHFKGLQHGRWTR